MDVRDQLQVINEKQIQTLQNELSTAKYILKTPKLRNLVLEKLSEFKEKY